ncbi:MAG: sugar ABC transporter permease [Anaerolineae bacterium]|nr:sugar ABC transporter permease [Anaerolineae bacterium]MCA9908244.1 sugar ABC transporter permease [Anaerolineae bacterium]
MAQSDSVMVGTSPSANERPGQKRGFFNSSNPWLWLSPALIFLLLYSLGPLILNLVMSFTEFKARQKTFEFIGLENWSNLFQDSRFQNAVNITLQYVVIALIIQVCLGLLIAVLLDARPFGVGLMQTLIILPMVTAPVVSGMLFRLLTHSEFGYIQFIFQNLGLVTKAEPLIGGKGIHALMGVLLVEIWQWTPFIVLIVLAGLKSIPPEVLEAAQVDGANGWQRFWWVKLPLLRTVLSIAILFRLVDLFRVFDYVAVLTAGGPALHTETLSYYGYVNTFQQVKFGYGATIGVFVMIVVWIVAFSYIRIFRMKW